jgi:hypothetical protein
VAGPGGDPAQAMELMALATSSVTNLLPELPDSPFDNDSFGNKDCYPSLGRDASLGGKDRDSGSGGGLGVDADCIFAYDDNDRDSDSDDNDAGGDMPFAWAQPNADMFEFDRSFSGKQEGGSGGGTAALSSSPSQSFIAQQCMAPPVLSSFEQSSGYGRQNEAVSDCALMSMMCLFSYLHACCHRMCLMPWRDCKK